MKMSAAQIERTVNQLDAEAIPVEHPMMPQLIRLFGEHTYFLDGKGLNIVEPVAAEQADGQIGVVVNLANWTDASAGSLQPHEPEPTEHVVALEPDRH
jgi:hypothetical protein